MAKLVHAPQGSTPTFALVAVLDQFADDNVRVIIAFLSAVLKLGRPVQQGRYTRYRIRPEQRKLQGPGGIEREVDTGAEEDDALVVFLRVQVANLFENRR